MSALARPRMKLLRWLAFAVALVVAVPVLSVLALHYRSRDPHTAARSSNASANLQVKPVIEHRAQQFLAALRTGDESQLRAMALTGSDRDSVSAFVTAFGRRDDQLASLQASEFGGANGVLDIAVPCQDKSVQHATVLFEWKRTSFISSGWYAIINPPGQKYGMPNGCPRP